MNLAICNLLDVRDIRLADSPLKIVRHIGVPAKGANAEQ
jgi:hypothetical protein